MAVEAQATALNMGTIMTILMMKMRKNMNPGTMKIEMTLNNNFYTFVVQYLSHSVIFTSSLYAVNGSSDNTHIHLCIHLPEIQLWLKYIMLLTRNKNSCKFIHLDC